jgi:transcriptional regulator with XRE-family HTH domain
MTKAEIGLILAGARRRSGKTQAELAEAMETPQSAVARAEAGVRMPTLQFIERWARATGRPITLKIGEAPSKRSAAERAALVRSVLGPGRFNPWDRNPAPAEAELLDRAGLTRKRFERLKQGRGHRVVISCEDLYVDRLRQGTVEWPREDISFDSAMAIALTNYGTLDWDFVRDRLRAAVSTEEKVGTLMVAVNRRVRSRARRANLGLGRMI